MKFGMSGRGVALRLMSGLAALALLTAVGGAVAVLSFDQFRASFNRVASTQLTTMEAASQLGQKSQALAGLAPSLFVKGLDTGTLLAFSTEVYRQQEDLQQLVRKLGDNGADATRVAEISAASDAVFRNADELSTIIFEKAGAEDELRIALSALGALRAKASSLSGQVPPDAATGGGPRAERAGRATLAWLDRANTTMGLVLRALSTNSSDDQAQLEVEMVTILRSMKDAASSQAVPAELLQLTERFVETLVDRRGIIPIRRRLVNLDADARKLLDESALLLQRLNMAVDALADDIRADITEQNSRLDRLMSARSQVMTALGVLGLVSAIVIAAYFQFSVIRRLSLLRRAMLNDEDGGRAQELAKGRDEIADLARSFTHYAEEIRRREEDVRRSEKRLTNAIESISEGFALLDADDRLVIANTRYRELLFSGDETLMRPGTSFSDILREAVARGYIVDAADDPDAWIAERLRRHSQPGPPFIQRHANDHWVQISERKTDDGGTVAVYSDITELKQNEQALAEKSSALEQLSLKLSKYLSRQVYESIFQGKQDVKVTSSRKKLTVFFSDIVGFTETSDRLESEDLTQILNRYLTEMAKIALHYGATVDKYIGDAIMAFFGDPESRGVKNDALACVQMAIAMRERLRELDVDWRKAGISRPLRCRIGIHTDFCTVGNFGSEDRLEYTIIGGGVNTASRLESLAKPGEILISYETYAQVSDQILCEPRGEIEVKGIAYPVGVYQVVDGYDRLESTRRNFREELPHAHLSLDIAAMTEDERRNAAQALQRALDRLLLEDVDQASATGGAE